MAEGRRYLGLDLLALCRINLITNTEPSQNGADQGQRGIAADVEPLQQWS